MKLAIVGASGFIGSAVAAAAEAGGEGVAGVRAPRLTVPSSRPPGLAAREWIDQSRTAFDQFVATLAGASVVVNAAGLADPAGHATDSMHGANAVLPVVVALASREAGVSRLVHVSSAAVQGRRDPLDESAAVDPPTPYARSKAEGELALADEVGAGMPVLSIYRPTSVQGVDRAMTRQLVKIASHAAVPLAGHGNRPLPVCLVQNVAAGVLHVCRNDECPTVVLQPSEGMTSRSLMEAFGARRLVGVPVAVSNAGLRLAGVLAPLSPRLAAMTRRLELGLLGQRQSVGALTALGFLPPVGPEGYVTLAHAIRAAGGPS